MINKKTAALLAGSTIIGAIQGGADPQNRQHLFVFATELGLAFQLQDDLLDAFGTEAQLGKPIGGDILEAKKSFLLLTALQRADGESRKHLLNLLHDNTIAPTEKIAEVLRIYNHLGVREVAEAEITAHFNKAMEALDALDAEPERITPLRELALGLLGRNK